jgi:hypothetical protein
MRRLSCVPVAGDPGSDRPVDVTDAGGFDKMTATGAVVVDRRTFELAGGW